MFMQQRDQPFDGGLVQVQFRQNFHSLGGLGLKLRAQLSRFIAGSDEDEPPTVLRLAKLALESPAQQFFLHKDQHKTNEPEPDDYRAGDDHLERKSDQDQTQRSEQTTF